MKGLFTMKKIISILLTCVVILSVMPMAIYGAVPEQIVPMWDNAYSFTADLDFTGTNGDVYVTVLGQSGVTNISAEIKLYYKNTSGAWVEEPKDWDYSVNQMILNVNESFTGVAGREYKIEVEVNVKKNGITETLTETKTAVCPRT